MPSKGIDFYGFVAKGYEISIRKANAGNKNEPDVKENVKADKQSVYFSRHDEIETANWKGRYEGTFQFIAKKEGNELKEENPLYERSLRVNGNTGSIESEDIRNILIDSIIDNNFCLSFGLYYSDAAILSDLPNAHQVWATLTKNHENWQGELFNKFLNIKEVKLSNLILPGSHDAGMYTNLGLPALVNLANTQKENISQQLKLGARFFDFRPAELRPDFEQGLQAYNKGDMIDSLKKLGLSSIAAILRPFVGQMRHLHSFIPGCEYDDFINQTLSFLNSHPKEVVIVKISQSGIDSFFAKIPSMEDIMDRTIRLIDDYYNSSNYTKVKLADSRSLDSNIQHLLDNNMRLILIKNEEIICESSYNDKDQDRNYKSYEASHIINALEFVKQNLSSASNKQLIDLQLQLTATGNDGAVARAITATNPATSPLLATKARTDKESYKWLADNLPQFENSLPLISIINDFYDNGLTEVCVNANERRLNNLPNKPI